MGAPHESSWGSWGSGSALSFFHPGSLANVTLVDSLHPSRAPRVPGVVSSVAVRALVSDRLLGLVLAEAGLGVVGAAADAAHCGERAGSLVVSVLLAPETAERLWGVRPKVEGAPAPEIDMRWKGTSDGDKNLASGHL